MPTNEKRPARMQHVVAHHSDEHIPSQNIFDEVLVFGQEIDALRHTHGKPGWAYAAIAHGQSFTEALKAAQQSTRTRP